MFFGRYAVRGVTVLFLAWSAAFTQAEGLRVVTWNISNYTGGRGDAIQTVVYDTYEGRSLAPDIIIAQEFMSAAAATAFRGYLNTAPGSPGDWSHVYVAGSPEGNVMFYRTSKVQYFSYQVASTAGPRNIIRYYVRLQGYASNVRAGLWVYNAHLKAGSASSDKSTRLAECQALRSNSDALAAGFEGAAFVFGGDYNMQTSSEDAYQTLLAAGAGRFVDPIASPGSWQNNSAFRFIHTQDPIGAGGMDDRYDIMLVSASLTDGSGLDYLGTPSQPYSTTTWNDPHHSYRAWGNDGTSCCGSALRVSGNAMVGPTIAQAIIDCADSAGHIPVYLDLRVPAQVATSTTVLDFGDVPLGSTATAPLDVSNAGDVALWGAAGVADLHYTLETEGPFSAPSGAFTAPPGPTGNTHQITFDTSTLGPQNGLLIVNSDAADEPAREILLVGTVVPALCAGDVNCDGIVDFADIDPFVSALGYPGGQNWPGPCPWLAADANSDGNVTFADIDSFVSHLGAVCP